MAQKQTYTVPYRRKREGKTNYKRRLNLLKSQSLRLVVRASLKNIVVQLVTYDERGDKVVCSAHSRELIKLGLTAGRGNVCAAYLVGLIIAKKAAERGISSAVLDMGLAPPVPGSRIFAVVRGAREGGLDIPCNEKVLPSEDRVGGQHVAAFAQAIKHDRERFGRQFGAYLKAGTNPEKYPLLVEGIKKKIMSA